MGGPPAKPSVENWMVQVQLQQRLGPVGTAAVSLSIASGELAGSPHPVFCAGIIPELSAHPAYAADSQKGLRSLVHRVAERPLVFKGVGGLIALIPMCQGAI
ncbi:hypothetical protein GB937_010688 [Aspergillus fischeri]|nr:hypothetical protein GB937_010688 [Aspergillus fischeri]